MSLTPAQAEALEAMKEHGSQQKAADALGISRRSLRERLHDADQKRLKLFGTSTLYDKDGEVVMEWEKRRADSEQIEQQIKVAAEAYMEPLKGLHKPIKAPKTDTKDLLTEYVIGDAHLGMYAWAEETGEDFDLNIAERDLCAAMDRLVSVTPASDEAVLNQVGDYFHIDDSTGLTPGGKNRLDFDSRYYKVITVGIRAERYLVERMLQKHKRVRIRNTPGNHDPHSYVPLTVAMLAYYENDDRVIIESSPMPFWAYRFHNNLVIVAHGDDPKPPELPGLMAQHYAEWWAQCEFKYGRHGHFHKRDSFESMGVSVEGVRTLAAKDYWHFKKGYRSGREMQAIVLHKEFGEQARHICGIKMVRDGR